MADRKTKAKTANNSAALERQRKVARYHLRGRSYRWIGQKLRVSSTQVFRDLKAVHERWIEDAKASLDEVKRLEVAKIQELEETYWRAWERSVGVHTKKTVDVNEGGEEDAGSTKTSTTTEELVGDPRFLAGVERCRERIAKLFGLDAPAKIDATVRGHVLYAEKEIVEAV